MGGAGTGGHRCIWTVLPSGALSAVAFVPSKEGSGMRGLPAAGLGLEGSISHSSNQGGYFPSFFYCCADNVHACISTLRQSSASCRVSGRETVYLHAAAMRGRVGACRLTDYKPK